jgi:regulator of CtrA degradation
MVGFRNRENADAGAAAFVQSALFARTFREGMALVEETASYLDGEGRTASKELSRDAAMSYAGASMRLTTQLMQIASWLLVLRAVRENEMALAEAAEPKYRLEAAPTTSEDYDFAGLPEKLLMLIENSRQLYARIARLDADIFGPKTEEETAGDVAEQQQALLEAFGRR